MRNKQCIDFHPEFALPAMVFISAGEWMGKRVYTLSEDTVLI
jgi:hypothetical protein